jgi:hypothetical protein
MPADKINRLNQAYFMTLSLLDYFGFHRHIQQDATSIQLMMGTVDTNKGAVTT